MRISLKQTILLSTALLAVNLPLSAMEEDVKDKPISSALGATTEIPIAIPVSEKAKRMSKNFFGEETPSSFTVFQSIAELLGEKSTALPVTAHERFASDTEEFKRGTLTLTAAHFNRPHPDFNAIYAELADNFLETVLLDGVEGKISGTSETIDRLVEIHNYFKALVDKTSGKIQQHEASLAVADTEATRSAAEGLMRKYNDLNQSLKDRFLNLLHHFSATRKFIIQANKTIASKKMVIENASSKDLVTGNIGESSIAISVQLEKDIIYLKKTIIAAETLIHTLYDFDRTDRDLTQVPHLLGKGVILFQSALKSAAGMITVVHNENRILRHTMTGEYVLPHSITVSTIFDSEACYGATDTAIHDRHMEYIQKILKPTPVLFDAIENGRIRFEGPVASAEKSSSGLQADSKGAADDVGGDKKDTEVKSEVTTDLNALAITAAITAPNSTVVDVAGSKDGNSVNAVAKRRAEKEKKPTDTGILTGTGNITIDSTTLNGLILSSKTLILGDKTPK